MEKFTASEVRDHAIWVGGVAGMGNSKTYTMLRAYADRLEADEKAAPVATVEDQFGFPIMEWLGDAGDRCPVGTKLYTHPSPADAERLAEALHSIGERLSSVLCDPFGEVVARGSDGDRQVLTQALKDLGDLAANSAQAQPPAASVPGELAGPSKDVLNYEQELSFADGWNACRAAILAAQEKP